MPAAPRRYVALLRAVNVGGSFVKMADLRARCEAAGLADVSTYIQSGNLLLSSAERDPARLARRIEAALEPALRRPTTVFLRTRAQLAKAAAANPFEPRRLEAEQRCHLMFLSRAPAPPRRAALLALAGEDYRFAVRGPVLYYAYSRAFDGRRRAIDFEKVLGVTGTARTWKVVDKLVELLA
jgi:uncharacterized protein (DUF1697 family)